MPTKNTFIINPKNSSFVYGRIPNMKSGRDYFEAGDIKLRFGEHRRANRGFGVVHIWAEHSNELIRLGYKTIEDVPNYISDIIVVGAQIYCEFNDIRSNHRLAVLKTAKGIVYLERKSNGNNDIFYSVVTAFRKNKAHGTRIGSVC